VVANGTTGCGAGYAMLSGRVPHYPTDNGAFHAPLRLRLIHTENQRDEGTTRNHRFHHCTFREKTTSDRRNLHTTAIEGVFRCRKPWRHQWRESTPNIRVVRPIDPRMRAVSCTHYKWRV
jgi:hypothetical protein